MYNFIVHPMKQYCDSNDSTIHLHSKQESSEFSTLQQEQESGQDGDSYVDPSYQPDTDELDSDSDSDQSSKSYRVPANSFMKSPQALSDHELNDDDSDESEYLEPLNTSQSTVHVLKTFTNSQGNLGNKVHACVYCEQLLPNIARHLTLVHAGEVEVGRILSFHKGSKERRKLWEVLVNKGDFHHNYEVIKKGSGMVIPKYRKKEEPLIKGCVPCAHCKGMYTRTELYRHEKCLPSHNR